jgi:phosphoserine phosphatase
VRQTHLAEAGRQVRLKSAIPNLVRFLETGLEGCRFSFCVISAAPREILIAALDGIVAPENIHGTELEYDADSGEVRAIRHVPAGYGKVAVIEELQHRLGVTPDRVIYVGDGSSDVHVMLHVNNHDGFTIAVSDNKQLARIARTVVVSDNVFSVMVPVLDQVFGWRTGEIRELLEHHGLTLELWSKARTDHVQIAAAGSAIGAQLAPVAS